MSYIAMFGVLIGIGIFFLLLLLLSYSRNKVKLYNGILFNLFLLFFAMALVLGGLALDNIFLKIIMVIILVIASFILVFGLFIIIVGCFINAYLMFKRESLSIANMLTLFLGIGLVIFSIVANKNLEGSNLFIRFLAILFEILIIYFLLSFYNYFVTSILYGIYKPKCDKDYIIVLGSGLIDGYKVSKLLGGRIDKAIEFYNRQKQSNENIKIIFSGGQGLDESISEALAMSKYAIENGVDEKDIILEDRSTTTLENFKFSKEIMDSISEDSYNSIFATSNYHVLRASMYAEEIGLKSQGIGGKTAFYYLPNAMIREYIAIVFMKKKSYIFKVSLLSLFAVLLFIIELVNKYYLNII